MWWFCGKFPYIWWFCGDFAYRDFSHGSPPRPPSYRKVAYRGLDTEEGERLFGEHMFG